jgi:peptidyl-prolyl cis-trans isomerase D
MIENIRRYTGLIFVVIVLLLLGFVFMDTSGFFTRSGGGATVVTIHGRAYSSSEYNKLGSSPFELIQRLPDYRLFGFLNALRGDATRDDNQALQFFTSRMIIRTARDEFGIHPPEESVDDFVRGLRVFQAQPPIGSPPGTPGEFDQQAYNNFIQKSLGSFGMVESDFRELVRDIIATEELQTLVGGGMEGSRKLAEAMAVVRDQQLTASVASIDLEPFRESLDPSEEDLREWWETRKDRYNTEKKVKLSYALLSPEYPEEKEAEEPAEDADQDASAESSEADENTTDADEENAEPEKSEAEKEAERQQARDAIDKQVAIDTDTLITQVNDTEGAAFEATAKELGIEIRTTDWLTRDTLPPDLQLPTRSSASGTRLADIVFDLEKSDDPLAAFTYAVPVGEAQFIIVRLDELEASRQKTFEEASEEVRTQYLEENAKEALMAAVEDKTEALRKAIEGGQSFEEAAKALELEPRQLGPWGATDSLDNEFNARQIFQLASTVNPGEFAEPFVSDDRAVIIRVDSREVVKDDNRGQRVDQMVSNLTRQASTAAFDAWLRQQIEQAQVTLPNGS